MRTFKFSLDLSEGLVPLLNSYKNVLSLPIPIPAPSVRRLEVQVVAIPITLSAISTVVEFTKVSVPSTYKSPLILTIPVLSPTTPGSIIKLDGPAIVAVSLAPLKTDIPIPVVSSFWRCYSKVLFDLHPYKHVKDYEY